jgi:hypothetical protein
MTRTLLVLTAFLVLSVPAALAAPPAGKGKPEKEAGKSAVAAQQSADKNASKKCKAERESMGVDAFKAKYGTNPNKANAFGKCVSGKSKAAKDDAEAEESAAEEAAAKKCKAERESIGVDAFKAKHGTNKNKANAFGKCVSKLSKKAAS